MKTYSMESIYHKQAYFRLLLCLLMIVTCILTSCSGKSQNKPPDNPDKTYMYKNKEGMFSEYIIKSEIYQNKMKICFSGDVFSHTTNVECYANDFSVIDSKADFTISDYTLTINSDQVNNISGLRVDVSNGDYYLIRYLDSEEYAMLLYSFAPDRGMMESGDREKYYTEEEKKKQEEYKTKRKEVQDNSFLLIKGVWEDENHTVRMKTEDSEGKVIKIYKKTDGYWKLYQQINVDSINSDDQTDPVTIEVIEYSSEGTRYIFTLYNNMTELKSDFMEEKLKKCIE